MRRRPAPDPARLVQHRFRPDGRRPRARDDGQRGRDASASTERAADRPAGPGAVVLPAGRSFVQRHSPSSPRRRSARTTCRPRRCRWRWSPAAVANDGVIMTPHVMAEVRDSEGQASRRATSPSRGCTAMQPGRRPRPEASMMVGVVQQRHRHAACRSPASRWRPRRARPSSAPRRRRHTPGSSASLPPRPRGRRGRDRRRPAGRRARPPAARSPPRSPSRCSPSSAAALTALNQAVLSSLGSAMSRSPPSRPTGLQRPLRDPQPHRPWRHGRRLPGPRPAARPPGRAQGAVPRVRRPTRPSSSASAARRRPPPTSTTPTSSAIYDWGEEDGTYFIVMEYVDGRTPRRDPASRGPAARRTAPPTSPPTSPPRSASPTATASSTAT